MTANYLMGICPSLPDCRILEMMTHRKPAIYFKYDIKIRQLRTGDQYLKPTKHGF